MYRCGVWRDKKSWLRDGTPGKRSEQQEKTFDKSEKDSESHEEVSE